MNTAGSNRATSSPRTDSICRWPGHNCCLCLHSGRAQHFIWGQRWVQPCRLSMALTFGYVNTNVHTTMESYKLQICEEIEDNWYDVSKLNLPHFLWERFQRVARVVAPCSVCYSLRYVGIKGLICFACSSTSIDQFVFHSQMYGETSTKIGPPLT